MRFTSNSQKNANCCISFLYEALKAMAEKLTGVPRKLPRGSREVAKVIYRDGKQIDSIWSTK